MEITEVTVLANNVSGIGKKFRKGEIVKVRTISRISRNRALIELGGKRYLARVMKGIKSDQFIAKVVNIGQTVELKFIDDIGEKIHRINFRDLFLRFKKEFIQKLINSDNFVVNNFVEIENLNLKEKINEELRLKIKSIVKRYNLLWRIKNGLKGEFDIKGDFDKYILLQSIHNFYSTNGISFLLPLLFGEKRVIGSIEVSHSRDNAKTVLFNIYLKRDIEIIFLIYIGHDVVSCSVSANKRETMAKINSSLNLLKERIGKYSGFKKVEISVVPFEYLSGIEEFGLKTIDIRM